MGTHPIFESDFDCLTEMEVRANYCKRPGLPKTHSKKAVPLNRQLQALNGTYKSHETKEHEKKIKIGQKKLLERMKSDDSEFSIASTDDVASSKVEKLQKYQQKFERKALEGYVPPENPLDKIPNDLNKICLEIKTEIISDGEDEEVFLNQDNEEEDYDLTAKTIVDARALENLVDDPELQELQNQLFNIFITETELDIKDTTIESE